MQNYQNLLKSGIFTFVCGEDGTPMEIHTGLVKGLSKPLEKMTSNGMKESVDREAIFEDVDPRTFAHFAEYAYTGNYRATAKGGHDEALPIYEAVVDLRVAKYCCKCARDYEELRCTSSKCQSTMNALRWYCTYCGKNVILSGGTCEPSCQPPQPPAKEPFLERKYMVGFVTHEVYRERLFHLNPPDPTTDEVACHARLYVFAQQFMINSLKQLCLHKLHRDLSYLILDNRTVSEVVELLTYTYDNTSADTTNKDGKVEEGTGKELRELVVTYAAWKAEKLMQYEAFTSMLAEGGDLVPDIFALALKRAAGNKA